MEMCKHLLVQIHISNTQMQAIQYLLRVQFAEPKHTRLISDRILEALGGESANKSGNRHGTTEGARLRVKENNSLTEWTTNHCKISVEELSNPKKEIQFVLSQLEKINGVERLGQFVLTRFSIFWIIPTPAMNFHELEKIYRANMISKNVITDLALDSSVILDFDINGLVFHHQSGAMEPKQLRSQYLRYDNENIPKSFLFLETTIIYKDKLEYDKKAIEIFLDNSLRHCTTHSNSFENIWGGML